MGINERVMIAVFAVAYLAVCVLAVNAIGNTDTQSEAITAAATVLGVIVGLAGTRLLDSNRIKQQELIDRQMRWEAAELQTVESFQAKVARVIAATAGGEAIVEGLEDASSPWEEVTMRERLDVQVERAETTARDVVEMTIGIRDRVLRESATAIAMTHSLSYDENALPEEREASTTELLRQFQCFMDRYEAIREQLIRGFDR